MCSQCESHSISNASGAIQSNIIRVRRSSDPCDHKWVKQYDNNVTECVGLLFCRTNTISTVYRCLDCDETKAITTGEPSYNLFDI